jgi:hypothetical protein
MMENLRIYNLRIYNLRISSPTKFAEICELTYLRNLRICDCGLSPRICGFKKTVAWPFLQIYSGAWGKLIHEKNQNLKSKILWHCPFKLSFACTKLYKVKTADSRCHSLANWKLYPMNLLKGPLPPHTHTQVT